MAMIFIMASMVKMMRKTFSVYSKASFTTSGSSKARRVQLVRITANMNLSNQLHKSFLNFK